MQRTDLDLEELRHYRPPVEEPEDFDAFWSSTIDEARRAGKPVWSELTSTPLTNVDVYDIRFPGFGGDLIAAWLILPRDRQRPMPVVVEFQPYNAGRGLSWEHLRWAGAGCAHLVVDNRGQGSGWMGGGVTPDPYGTGPSIPGFLTRGIEDVSAFYYRRLITDAVRAIDAVGELPMLDGSRIVTAGLSQGGGLAVAAAALHDDVSALLTDVPFLCNFPRSIGLTGVGPYQEVIRYLSVHHDAVGAVFSTLAYVDTVNFARRARVPALFSTALMDDICPPSGPFAAYNWYAGARKQISVYAFNGHEGGGAAHWERQSAFVASVL